MSDCEPFVDADRGGEFLNLTRRRLLEMARSGEIPAHPIGRSRRRTWRFRLSELAEAIATKTAEHPSRWRGIIDPGGSLAVPKGKGR